MKNEKMVMMTGREYQQIKQEVASEPRYEYNIGTDSKPEVVYITDIYLDTDPEFTRNPKQYAKVHDDKTVQVRIEYDI